MNREIDFKEIWDWITTSADWLLYGIVALSSLNVLFGLYFAWSIMTQSDFFSKYNLNKSQQFVQQAEQLEPVPAMDEIDVPTPESQKSLPTRYVKLRKTNLFTPLGYRAVAQPVPADTEPKQKELPSIKGYQIVGRISGQGEERVSMLRRTDDGKTFVAREGEFLADTDIKVARVSDTVVLLKQPAHKPTRFQFKTDQIEQRLKEGIMLH